MSNVACNHSIKDDYLPLNTHTLLRILIDVDDELTNLKLNNDRLSYTNERLQKDNEDLANQVIDLKNEIEQYKITEYEENINL